MGNVGFICSPDGAKSSYEIGCIKAIKELNTDITATSGAFVGVINAVLIAVTDIDGMVKFWRTASKIGLTDIINRVSRMYVEEWERYDRSQFMMKYLTFVVSDDSDMQKLRKLLGQYITENAVKSASVKCSIVGVSPYTFELECFSAEKIPKGQLIDYIMCSVLYPVLSVTDGKTSGVLPYESSPYKAIDMFSPSLVLSTDEMSAQPNPSESRMNIKLIRPTEMMPFSFNESAQDMIKNIRLGYIDTLREVSFSYGSTYYINRLVDDSPESLKSRMNAVPSAHSGELISFLLRISGSDPKVISERIAAMLLGAGIKSGDMYVALTENAASLLGIDKTEKYTDKSLREVLSGRIKKLCVENAGELNDVGKVISVIENATDGGVFTGSDLIAKYFLIFYAADPSNYDALTEFAGSLHLKIILAVVVMIYLVG